MEKNDKMGPKKDNKIMKLDTADFDQEIVNSKKHIANNNLEEAKKFLENAERILSEYEIKPKELKLYQAEVLATKIRINKCELRKNKENSYGNYDVYLLSDIQDAMEDVRLLIKNSEYLFDEATMLEDVDITNEYEIGMLSSAIASALDADYMLTELERTSKNIFSERDELNEVLFDCYDIKSKTLLTNAKKLAIEGFPEKSFDYMKKAIVCQKMAENYMPVEKRIDAYEIKRLTEMMKSHMLPGSENPDFEKHENEMLEYMASDPLDSEIISDEKPDASGISSIAGKAYSKILGSAISFLSDSKPDNISRNHDYGKG